MGLLREFLYLDTRLVDNYLAQVEGGLYSEVRMRAEGTSGVNGKAAVAAGPLDLGAGGEKSSVTETERVVRETPEARFNRLYEQLSAESHSALSGPLFSEAKKGQFWDLECEISVPSSARLFGQLDQIGDIAALAEAFGAALPGYDEKTKAQIDALAARVDPGKFVAEGFVSESQPTFAFRLDRAHLRVELDELEAELNVVGKVEGKWPAGESRSLVDLPGINLMSRRDRREMAKKGGAGESEGLSMPGPGVSMSVIAIFR